MNHSWLKDKDYIPELPLTEKCVCKMCGCIRYKSVMKYNGIVYTDYEYTRSRINFNYRPDCIDWSDNTIIESDEIMMFT